MLPSIYEKDQLDALKARINSVSKNDQPLWGSMNASQMMAHLNVSFDIAFTNKYKKPGFLKKLLLKTFVKKGVVNDVPYPKNARTAPEFIITDTPDFATQQKKLLLYLNKVHQIGDVKMHNRVYPNFGKLTAYEWNTMFVKHIDHHLKQFGK